MGVMNTFQPPPTVSPAVERVVAIIMQSLMNTRPKMSWEVIMGDRTVRSVSVVHQFMQTNFSARRDEPLEMSDMDDAYFIRIEKDWGKETALAYHPKKDAWWKGANAYNAIFFPHRGSGATRLTLKEAEHIAASSFGHYPVQVVSDKAIEAAKSVLGERMKTFYPRR